MTDKASTVNISHLLPLVVVLATLSNVAVVICYRLFFHPLSKYPGPKLAAITEYWWAWNWTSGKWIQVLERVHDQYGDVVRIGPNELSFIPVASLNDIYGHSTKTHTQMLKTNFYKNAISSELEGIIGQRDPEVHRATRRLLSHAFSAKALRDQTTVVLKYVNMFVDLIQAKGVSEEGIDVTEWYNWLTFDIIGDLAFGESFGAVKQGKSHPWIDVVSKNMQMNTIFQTTKRITLLSLIRPLILLFKRNLYKGRLAFTTMSRAMAQARKTKPNDRDDFFSHLLSDKSFDISDQFLTAQAQSLIFAGSETTATTMASLTFYLLRSPETFKALTEEVRGAFTDSAQIDTDSTAALPYLFAVIEEGLRMFPAVATGLPRYCPGAYIAGHYIPAGTVVSASLQVVARSPANFALPRTFAPARWLPETHPLYDPVFAADNKDATKPFSVGPRACLGKNLAYMELRIILAKLVWHFDWVWLNRDLDWDDEVQLYTLWKKPAFNVRFIPVSRDKDVVVGA